MYFRTSPNDDTILTTFETIPPDWSSIRMNATSTTSLGDFGRETVFKAQIPAATVDTRGVDYFMRVEDGNTQAFWPGTTYQGYLPQDGIRTGYMHVHVLETPHIVHAPVLTAPYRKPIAIQATANCPIGRSTCSAQLFWRTTTGSILEEGAFNSARMQVANVPNGIVGDFRLVTVSGAIPAEAVDTRGVDYFISVSDGATTTWFPGTSQIDGYVAVSGTRVGYLHTRVIEPPHVVPTTPVVTKANEPFPVTIAANCATETCAATLFYAQVDVTGAISLDPTEFTKLPMARTSISVPSTLGNLNQYAATIPAAAVTTRGLIWYAQVNDGYTNAFAPGTSYNGAYIPTDGALLPPAGYPDTGLVAVGDALRGTFAFPVRVLEPPHTVYVPPVVTPPGLPLEVRASSNCSYSPCVGVIEWLDAAGEWQSELMRAQKGQLSAAGIATWSFASEIPSEDTNGASVIYRLSVSDGHVEDATQTFSVATNSTAGVGSVGGTIWYDGARNSRLDSDDPRASGVVVRATRTDAGPANALFSKEATTTANGDYVIRGLIPGGNYTISVPTAPAGGGALNGPRMVTIGTTSQAHADFSYSMLDSDGDGVPDRVEIAFGLNPGGGSDTDGDGLTDSFEILKATGAHSPGKRDTNNNGVQDGVEDEDRDGLTALREQAAGTSALNPDTDRDSIDDAAELRAGTNPLQSDSDADGSSDAAEIRNATNSFDPDTDRDGIRDGDDSTQSTTSTAGATVTLNGKGDLSGPLTITRVPNGVLTGGPGQISAPIEVHLPEEATANLSSAQLTLNFNPATVSTNPADLRIYTWNPQLNYWVPAGNTQTVNTAAGTVQTTLPHFSIFALFDRRVMLNTFEDEGDRCAPIGNAANAVTYGDVAFVLDSSGSMLQNDPEGLRLQASTSFVDSLLPLDRGAVVDFDDSAAIVQPLTSDKSLLNAAITSIDADGGTDIGAGVREGISALGTAEGGRGRLLVLLTDGDGAYDPELTNVAVRRGIQIVTIGLGAFVNDQLLQGIATSTGGQYFPVSSSDGLSDVLQEIAQGPDTDEDGLSDCEEKRGTIGGDGITYFSNPTLPDTDSDGLLDGEEITQAVVEGGLDLLTESLGIASPYFRVVMSSPTDPDLDRDNLLDPVEADFGTGAFTNDSDSDGLLDSDEAWKYQTDPANANTDGDNHLDGFEATRRDRGYDPLVYDEEVSKWEYARDFALGASCPAGWSWCEAGGDTIAFFAGSLTGGFFGYKDVLDVIGAVTTGDFVSAAFDVLFFLPLAGDAVSVAVKGAKFIKRISKQLGAGSRKAIDGLAFLMKRSELPLSLKMYILRQYDGSTVKNISKHFSDTSIAAFAARRIDFHVLSRAIDGASEIRKSPRLYDLESVAEAELRAATPGALPKQMGFPPVGGRKPGSRGNAGYRFPDIFVPVIRKAIEAKNGFWKALPYVKEQIRKDVALRADLNTPINEVEWHFFEHTDGSVGPDDELRELLEINDIPYVLYAS
ncbi:VWA domain-containing protein [Nocardioides rubriscoriae]|uniref:VWA domain-containing protein n=1 Tax=Nocardioides rubriscoriae TaxID=642762 RepID=UPI001478F15C|nr:VWA domain-containing protein [Nocardioides rubriscoriae]